MESAYGIGVQNRYALFLDEDDDGAGVDPFAAALIADAKAQQAAAAATAAGGKAGGPKSALPAAAKTNLPAANKNQPTGTLSESKANVAANQKDSGRRDNRSRSGNQTQRPNNPRGDQENRTLRSPRQNNFERSPRPYGGESQGQDGELKEGGGGRDFRDGKDRRNGFGVGGGRGARRGGGFGGSGAPGGPGGQRFERKRDFNRHSGSDKTGIKATDKRDGAGAHNWGKSVDDFTAAPEEQEVNGEQATAEGAAPAEGAVEGAEGTGEGEKTAEGEEAPKSDEPVTKTLEEYKREREEKRLHAQFNTRKANEGEDKSKWKKTFILKKKPLAEEEEVEYEEIEVEEDSNKRRGRQVLDIEINFRPSDEGRDFVARRGRGGPGGRGGRGGPRGGGEGGPREGGRPPREGGERGGERGERSDAPRTPRGNGPSERGQRGGRGGRGGQGGGRFQATPKFDDLNDFPSL